MRSEMLIISRECFYEKYISGKIHDNEKTSKKKVVFKTKLDIFPGKKKTSL